MDREKGLTFPRMSALIELHARTTMRDLFNLGTAVALAFSDPAGLKEFVKEEAKVDLKNLPAMLRATTR